MHAASVTFDRLQSLPSILPFVHPYSALFRLSFSASPLLSGRLSYTPSKRVGEYPARKCPGENFHAAFFFVSFSFVKRRKILRLQNRRGKVRQGNIHGKVFVFHFHASFFLLPAFSFVGRRNVLCLQSRRENVRQGNIHAKMMSFSHFSATAVCPFPLSSACRSFAILVFVVTVGRSVATNPVPRCSSITLRLRTNIFYATFTTYSMR